MAPSSLTDSLRETVALFDAGGEPRTTSEVAGALDLGRRSTYDRLDRLVDAGRLETKKVGASARVWWRPGSTRPESAAASDSIDRSGSPASATEQPAGSPPAAEQSTASSGDSTPSPPLADGPATAGSLVEDVLDSAAVGVFVLDEAFEVVWLNDATERYFGLDRDRVLGRDKRRLVEDRIAPVVDDGESFADTVLATYEDNTFPERFECRVTPGEDRSERWLEHRSEPIETGAYAGGRVEVYYDVTERVRAERARREDRDQFESLVDAVDEYSIFRLDTEGRIETWNAGARRTKGYEAHEAIGERFSIFYTEDDRAAGVPERDLEAAARRGSVEDEGWRVRKDGSRFRAHVTITAIRDEHGELDGYAKVTRDMTEKRDQERQLRRERDLIDRLFETSPVGIGVFAPDGTLERTNGRLEAMFDGVPADDATYASGDLPLLDAEGEPLPFEERPVGEVLRTGDPVSDREVQLRVSDGTVRWLSVDARPVTDDDGDLVRVVASATDVTRLKRQSMRLERRRDELESELADVFDRVGDAFLAIDDEWRFTYVNERAATLLERRRADLVGEVIWEQFPAAVGSTFESECERARSSGESVSFEEYFAPLDSWFEVTAYPSESGLSVYFRDVTDRKERERELERYETIVETMSDGVYVMDCDGRFTMVNRAYAEMTGYEPAELLGSHGSTVADEETTTRAAEIHRRLEAGTQDTARLEAELEAADGDRFVAEATFGLIETGEAPDERVGVVRDVTERKERERELEGYETIVETVEDGIYAVDDDARFVTVNEGFCELTGYDREELLGAHATTIHDDAITAMAEEMSDEIAAGERDDGRIELDIHTKSGESVPCENTLAPYPLGDTYGRCGVVRDVSDRLERERELRRRVHQQEVVTELGQRALEEHDVDALLAEAARVVAGTLDVDYCKVLDLDPGAEHLRLRQGVGWDEGVVGEAAVSAVENDSQASYTLAADAPVMVTDLGTESRFGGPALLTDHDVSSGISTVVGTSDEPWGILGAHDTDRREFSERDVNFVQSVATILANAISRHEDEQALVKQREQLAALNNINEVVRGIIEAVVDQSTREEIEATVCDRLAAADSYLFAWIGDVDPGTRTVNLRTEAGVEDYLDGVTISVDPDDERSDGATGRALRTGEIQTTRDIRSDSRYDAWRDHVAEYGFRSSAAIPIVHDETVYGALNVYAERPNAFEGRERTVIEQLGEVVGHAIAATERKRTLMSDEVVELEFGITDIFAALDVDHRTDGRVTLDHAVPLGDDEFIVYGTATGDAVEGVGALVEGIPHWERVRFRGDGDNRTFELLVSEPPVLSTLASVGGAVEEAVIEGGDFRMTIHHSPGVDARRVTDVVQDAYPEATLLKRHQLTRPDGIADRVRHALGTELTDRQRTTLEAAYYAGFFEWPRDVTGEEVADSLDVSPPTFHQHLRTAERKLLDSLLSGRFGSA
jgi:PAS domain S-box-containing protein